MLCIARFGSLEPCFAGGKLLEGSARGACCFEPFAQGKDGVANVFRDGMDGAPEEAHVVRLSQHVISVGVGHAFFVAAVAFVERVFLLLREAEVDGGVQGFVVDRAFLSGFRELDEGFAT